jgi:hypothetical protein
MGWTEDSKKAFDSFMEQEKRYAAMEQSAVGANDFRHAEQCHKLRWRCMDAAVAALREEKITNPGTNPGL